ncbi:MAG: hypothetical protein PHQ40_13625 [Anaerolineaceae bacterium]|nr:hypothetical protein [Anaerolineaceae bacterium]
MPSKNGITNDRDHHFTPHHLALEVRAGVVLPGVVVAVTRGRSVGGQLLQPVVKILVQPGFIIADEVGGGDVHGDHQQFTIPAFDSPAGLQIWPNNLSMSSFLPDRDRQIPFNRIHL